MPPRFRFLRRRRYAFLHYFIFDIAATPLIAFHYALISQIAFSPRFAVACPPLIIASLSMLMLLPLILRC